MQRKLFLSICVGVASLFLIRSLYQKKGFEIEQSLVFVDVFSHGSILIPEAKLYKFSFTHEGALPGPTLRVLGAVVSKKKNLIMVSHPSLYASAFEEITVEFYNGDRQKGSLVYQDVVLGIAMIQVSQLPKGVEALKLADGTETSGRVYHNLGENKGVPITVDFVNEVRGRTFMRWVPQEDYPALDVRGALVSDSQRLVGFTVSPELEEGQFFVGAADMRKALQSFEKGQSYQPRFVDINVREVSVSSLMYSGLLNKEHIREIKQDTVLVVIENKNGLETEDVILKMNGKDVGLGSLQKEGRDMQELSLDVVRKAERQTVKVQTSTFPEDKVGLLVHPSFVAVFLTPFLQSLFFPNYSIGTLAFFAKSNHMTAIRPLDNVMRGDVFLQHTPETMTILDVKSMLETQTNQLLVSRRAFPYSGSGMLFVKKGVGV